jgi:hypothetical protein
MAEAFECELDREPIRDAVQPADQRVDVTAQKQHRAQRHPATEHILLRNKKEFRDWRAAQRSGNKRKKQASFERRLQPGRRAILPAEIPCGYREKRALFRVLQLRPVQERHLRIGRDFDERVIFGYIYADGSADIVIKKVREALQLSKHFKSNGVIEPSIFIIDVTNIAGQPTNFIGRKVSHRLVTLQVTTPRLVVRHPQKNHRQRLLLNVHVRLVGRTNQLSC